MPTLIDITGQRFGNWTVIEKAPIRKGQGAYWKCQCDCGKIKEVTGESLRAGSSTSCGCKRPKLIKEYYTNERIDKTINLLDGFVGKRFGSWTVLSFDGEKTYKGSNGYTHRQRMWNCVCDCGNNGTVSETALINGKSKSCGCLKHKWVHDSKIETRRFVTLKNNPSTQQMLQIVLDKQNTETNKTDFETALTIMFPVWWNNAVRREMASKKKCFPELTKENCEICGKKCKTEWHHIISVSNYGGNEPQNIVCLCKDCHKKADKGEIRFEQ